MTRQDSHDLVCREAESPRRSIREVIKRGVGLSAFVAIVVNAAMGGLRIADIFVGRYRLTAPNETWQERMPKDRMYVHGYYEFELADLQTCMAGLALGAILGLALAEGIRWVPQRLKGWKVFVVGTLLGLVGAVFLVFALQPPIEGGVRPIWRWHDLRWVVVALIIGGATGLVLRHQSTQLSAGTPRELSDRLM